MWQFWGGGGGSNHVITNLDYQKDKLKAGHDAIHSNSTNVFAFQGECYF